jgi:chemotaxis protein MotB
MAKKKKQECQCPQCLPGWLAAFGDLMSLLLTFFVLLLSMSTMDRNKIAEAIGSLNGAMSVLEGGTKSEVSHHRQQLATPLDEQEETADSVNRIASAVVEANEFIDEGGGPAITLEDAEEGFMINLPAKLLFADGSAKIIGEDALLFLKRVSQIVTQFPKDVEVSVRGYTDNRPVKGSSIYEDNWDLSAARAISVVKELVKNGVSSKAIHGAGFGEFRPIASNFTEEGQARNRRVEIRFIARKKETKEKALKSILDSGINNEVKVKEF